MTTYKFSNLLKDVTDLISQETGSYYDFEERFRWYDIISENDWGQTFLEIEFEFLNDILQITGVNLPKVRNFMNNTHALDIQLTPEELLFSLLNHNTGQYILQAFDSSSFKKSNSQWDNLEEIAKLKSNLKMSNHIPKYVFGYIEYLSDYISDIDIEWLIIHNGNIVLLFFLDDEKIRKDVITFIATYMNSKDCPLVYSMVAYETYLVMKEFVGYFDKFETWKKAEQLVYHEVKSAEILDKIHEYSYLYWRYNKFT